MHRLSLAVLTGPYCLVVKVGHVPDEQLQVIENIGANQAMSLAEVGIVSGFAEADGGKDGWTKLGIRQIDIRLQGQDLVRRLERLAREILERGDRPRQNVTDASAPFERALFADVVGFDAVGDDVGDALAHDDRVAEGTSHFSYRFDNRMVDVDLGERALSRGAVLLEKVHLFFY